MAKYATLSDLLLRGSADDLAGAASRDQPSRVNGALLRRAAQEPQPLDEAGLDRIRTETNDRLYAGVSSDSAFSAAEFTSSSTTNTAAVPDYSGAHYLGVAVPDSYADLDTIQLGGGLALDQFDAFAGPEALEIAGEQYKYWRSKRPFSDRSAGIRIAVAPFRDPKALWDGGMVAALPGTLNRIAAALDDADAEIDGRIGPRYPDAVPTRTLTARACDIAVFGIVGGDQDSEEARRWESSIRYLRDLASGAVDLESPEPAANDEPTAVAPPSVFGRDRLNDYLGGVALS